MGNDTEATQHFACSADANVLEFFDFPLVFGDASSALSEAGRAVLTRRMAVRSFGTEDVLGLTLTIKGTDFTITGLLGDLPHQSSLPFEVLFRTTWVCP